MRAFSDTWQYRKHSLRYSIFEDTYRQCFSEPYWDLYKKMIDDGKIQEVGSGGGMRSFLFKQKAKEEDHLRLKRHYESNLFYVEREEIKL